MNIEIFREFISLTELEDYGEVSSLFYFSESTLARHIRQMEQELGTAVFDRTTKGIQINEYGRELLPYARSMLELWEKCAGEIAEWKRKHETDISILCGYEIGLALVTFNETCEDSTFRIVEVRNDHEAILKALRDGEYDFAVTSFEGDVPADLDSLMINRRYYRVILSKENPLSREEAITPAMLSGLTFWQTDMHEMETDPLVQQYFADHSIVPARFRRAANSDLMMTSLDDSSASIRRFTQRQIDALPPDSPICYKPLAPDLPLRVTLCWLRDRPKRKIEEQFIQFMQDRRS